MSPPTAVATAVDLPRLQEALLGWYGRVARDLPWRRTRDPYRVLVSEIMLQQTQAARVEPLYAAFCTRFPTVQALAEAPTGDVLRCWQGLGYNRRAVALQRAARAIVDEHGGRVPDDLDALRALPGVGDYTARAVLAFAHGRDAGPVDTNVARVLARAVGGRALSRREAQDLADAVVPVGRGAPWNHALMDLGATVCTARRARCEVCPLATAAEPACAWHAAGCPEPDPAATGALRPRPQATFAGSDRAHRGRLVDALRRGDVAVDAVAAAAGLDHDPARLARIVDGLVRDGLAAWGAAPEGDVLRLP